MGENNIKKVAVLMGSTSDEKVMQACLDMLTYFEIPFEKFILSAHRNFKETSEFAQSAHEKGFGVIVAGAGMAAHLPGVLAAQTILPVIGVPLDASPVGGVDALYSIVQMPPGIPVATVAIGKAGAKNAGVLAAQLLAMNNETIAEKLIAFRKKGSKI